MIKNLPVEDKSAPDFAKKYNFFLIFDICMVICIINFQQLFNMYITLCYIKEEK